MILPDDSLLPTPSLNAPGVQEVFKIKSRAGDDSTLGRKTCRQRGNAVCHVTDSGVRVCIRRGEEGLANGGGLGGASTFFAVLSTTRYFGPVGGEDKTGNKEVDLALCTYLL